MKTVLKSLLVIIMFVTCLPLAAQAPAYDELEFEPDSIRTPYKTAGKNFVFLRSKRGNNGLNKTPTADAISAAEVTEIVLVFSESNSSAIEEREEANRERWENLLSTYPEFFQYSTTYKSLCQCNNNGDSAAFKKLQGFYVYINGDVPKVTEPKVEEAPPVAKPAKVEPQKIIEKQVAVTDNTTVKTKPAPVVEPAVAKEKTPPVKEEEVKKIEPPAAAKIQEEEPAEEVVKATPKKKPAIVKPRKAKDARACRPACYGFGDEDLQIFFKDNIPLTKKQKRKAKNWIANVRLQINFDGTIKKAMVTGSEEAFNLQVQDVIKAMNPWNCAVKGGTAVKSEVRFTLKYDKASKAIKPFDLIMNPKGSPKCPCISDSEMFGSD